MLLVCRLTRKPVAYYRHNGRDPVAQIIDTIQYYCDRIREKTDQDLDSRQNKIDKNTYESCFQYYAITLVKFSFLCHIYISKIKYNNSFNSAISFSPSARHDPISRGIFLASSCFFLPLSVKKTFTMRSSF